VAERAVEQESEIEISGGIETEEEYGFVVQQGDDELREDLNQGLEEVIDNGEYATIYKKWFSKAPSPEIYRAAAHEPS
jgi:ABC-type amino acid transport substrate-binding protein